MVHAGFGMIATMVEYKDRLAQAMADANVSTRVLAGKLGLSYQAVKKVLDGKSAAFTAQNHDLAATFLGVSSSWLANEIGPKRVDSQPDLVVHQSGCIAAFELKTSRPGAMATQLAASLAQLPVARRKAVASLVAGLIESGPTPEEANAIDALAPDVSLSVEPELSWRNEAFRLAERADQPVRSTLVDFVTAVDKWVALESSKKQASGGEYRTNSGTAIVGS